MHSEASLCLCTFIASCTDCPMWSRDNLLSHSQPAGSPAVSLLVCLRSPGGSCRRLLRKSNTLCPRMMTSTTYNPDWSQSNTQASTCPHCQCNNTSKRYAYVLPPHILCEEPYKACDCYVSMSDRSMIHIKVGCG